MRVPRRLKTEGRRFFVGNSLSRVAAAGSARSIRSMNPKTLFALFACTVLAFSARGAVKEGLILRSQILGEDARYSIYLPHDYETSIRSYPVVYLLHGYGDDDTGWIQFGEIDRLADAAIASGEIPPMIIVMPDGKTTRYINNHDGSTRYEDFFIGEFLPAIESTYRIRREKRYRGVAGLSMGGYGALIYSMKHPDLFAACAALSAGIHTQREFAAMTEGRFSDFANVFGPELRGEARLTPHLLSYDPIHIVDTGNVAALSEVRYYLDCGDDDFLYEGNALLSLALRRRGIPHESRIRDGGHTWSYWRSGIIPGLKFIGESFHQP